MMAVPESYLKGMLQAMIVSALESMVSDLIFWHLEKPRKITTQSVPILAGITGVIE